jgi:hypothetical protein
MMIVMLILTSAVVLGYGSLATAANDPDFVLEYPGGTACDFDLRIEGWNDNQHQHVKEFRDENGNLVRIITAGTGSQLLFTNLLNGETFSTKSNGAVTHITYEPDGSYTETDTGHNVLILFPTDYPAGPSTTLIVGRLVYTVDLDGVWTVQEERGKMTDICSALSQ